ncbi:MAG: hypothetical protein HN576_08865 [Bacteriovoracaceae bacterium]|jgi:hypothetical protein|nr:hypothetical protein [Bacteriovoracaceae bacterium]
MKKDHFNPHILHQSLMKNKNAAGLPLFQTRPAQEVRVEILPDKSVVAAKFLPHDQKQGCFKAHPITIAAMRKDLFVGGMEEFSDLEKIVICSGCQKEIDQQFWIFCPYCETKY